MTTEERKPTWAMFKARERKTDRSPEYNLTAVCPSCGCDLRGAGWRKESGKGTQYVGGPIEVKGEYKPESKPEFNDDIPF